MRRFILFDNYDSPIGELSQNDVIALLRRESINGAHSLEISTVRVLDKGTRILYQDGRGVWREYVVSGVDENHAAGKTVVGTYYCDWSIQYDLMGVTVSVMPGVQVPVSAREALTSALSTQTRWGVGAVTNTATAGASMYDMSAWNALSVLVKTWGGELEATIGVSIVDNVVSRSVDLYAQQGEQQVKRRFDFGADLKSVKRKFDDAPYYCRISPRGKGEQSGDGYGRKITIESVNDGKDYLEYAPMVDICKMPDGNGGYQYPTLIVENSKCETPAALKAWALGVIESYCTPKVTYEVDVIQAAEEGVDIQGVSLGDAVNVVDRKFGADGLRLSGRVVSLTVNELNGKEVTVKIGYLDAETITAFSKIKSSIESVETVLDDMNSAQYISDLVNRLNAEINATGGYAYITQGQGIRTYDTEVSDPLVGAEASKVVEIKGGSIRIANSRTAQGEWDWKSVFTSGHIAADMITAVNITAGYIRSADNNSYWDLDSNQLVTTNINANGRLTSESTNSKTVIDGGYVELDYRASSSASWESVGSFIATLTRDGGSSSKGMMLRSPQYPATGSNRSRAVLSFNPFVALFGMETVAPTWSGDVMNPAIQCISDKASQSQGNIQMRATQVSMHTTNNVYMSSSLLVADKLTVNGTKNRKVTTDNYVDRLLYCYETPSPMFGDIGSGTIGQDGECYVSVDDIFGETARTDMQYQVFLQACGQGELYVSEKEPTHFVVSGTPGLAFDWEMKARQTEYENLRFEQYGMDIGEMLRDDDSEYPLDAYGDYAEEMEELYYGTGE